MKRLKLLYLTLILNLVLTACTSKIEYVQPEVPTLYTYTVDSNMSIDYRIKYED